MAFKSFSVALGTSNTDVVECPATTQGAAVISVSNITAGALTYALKLYRQATGGTVTIATGVSVAANTTSKFAAPISLESGDKIIMTSSSASNLIAAGTFTYSAATPAAVGFTPRGPWDSVSTYNANDVVSKNFNSYLAIQESTNQDPETQTAYWMLSAGRGPNGAGDLSAANNLSDLASAATAFANIKQAATASATGVVELATAAETTAGTDATRAITPDGFAGSDYGKRIVSILVLDDSQSLITGDGGGDVFWRVPSALNGYNLVGVAAQVQTAGTTGTTDVQIARIRSGSPVDMLSTKISIDSTEIDTATAATPAVINTSNDDVATGDQIRIDIDAVSTTPPKGLLVELAFQMP